MAQASPPELLVLHAVRLKGMVDASAVVDRFSMDRMVVEGLIRQYDASGLIDRVEFADLSGWALTDAGRVEDNRLLAEELDAAVTKWQLRPIRGVPWLRTTTVTGDGTNACSGSWNGSSGGFDPCVISCLRL